MGCSGEENGVESGLDLVVETWGWRSACEMRVGCRKLRVDGVDWQVH